MESYVFLDQYRSPPSPHAALYQDLASEFSKLTYDGSETPYTFFMSISALFRKLRDPHTLFVPPCLENFYFSLPFAFTLEQSSNDSSSYVIKGVYSHVRNITATWISNASNVDLINKTVTQINGTDALTYISEWVKEYGYISKYQHALFNRALRSEFNNRPAYIFEPPDETLTVNYLDEDGVEQEGNLTWQGIVYSTMTSLDDYCPLWSEIEEEETSSRPPSR